MNEKTLSEAMADAGNRLIAPIDDIVVGAVRDGRRQVRRRRRGTVLASAAAVAVAAVAVGGWWLPRSGSDEQTVTDGSSVMTSPTNAPSASGTPVVRRLAGGEEVRDRLLALLPDGEVTDLTVRVDDPQTTWAGNQPGVEVGLRLDGTPVRLMLMDYNRDADKVRAHWAKDPGPAPSGCAAMDPRDLRDGVVLDGDRDPSRSEMDCVTWNARVEDQKCAQAPSCKALDRFVNYSAKREVCNYNASFPCRKLDDGSWLAAGSGSDDVDTASPFAMANRFTTDGWYVYVSSENEPSRVLDADQVAAIVTSDAWFQ